jgi:plasmid maintenance system antidote protein VapI
MSKEIDLLLEKTKGSWENLSGEEQTALFHLLSAELETDRNKQHAKYYRDMKPIQALMHDIMTEHRITRTQFAESLNISYGRLSVLMNAGSTISSKTAGMLVKKYAIDGNYILRNI